MRVLSTFGDYHADTIRAAVPDAEVVAVPGDEPLGADVEGDVLLAMHRHAALEGLAARVPWIHLFGTGVDGTPPEVFEGRVVTCSRGAGAVPISEFVLAAMLAFEKQFPHVWITEPPERWNWAHLGGLDGRRLALVGLGGIGSRVARLALAFGMEVRALRRNPERPSPVEGVEIVGEVTDLVEGAHHVVVAAPATTNTRHLIDAGAFAAMGDGTHLVNIARGTLVDQDALRAALDSGRVAGASLDTCDPEPLPEGHWLYSHPRVRLSPHISWSSPDMGSRIIELFVENLVARTEGRDLAGLVDPEEGY